MIIAIEKDGHAIILNDGFKTQKELTNVNNEIAKFLQENYKTAGIEQEKAILEQFTKGHTIKGIEGKGLKSGFFTLNKDKMNALISSVTHDMKKAEHTKKPVYHG